MQQSEHGGLLEEMECEVCVEFTDLLSVVGRVGEHGGHVKHQLVVLIGGVERVRARGVRCNTGQCFSLFCFGSLYQPKMLF